MTQHWLYDFTAASNAEVLYEPSSTEVVKQMLAIAEVSDRDLVYDLGCGDGRIVIAAAQERGARGMGIDHDPVRVMQSRENAARAGVDERVRFFEEDLFSCDFSEADVVMLYLLPDANLRLRPRILRELKPGSRVVSHSHDMGTWEPDRSIRTGSYRIFLWIVPADVSGIWQWNGGDTRGTVRIRFEQKFQKLFGRFLTPADGSVLMDPELKGSGVRFTQSGTLDGRELRTEFTGTVAGDHMEGYAASKGISRMKMPWSAIRISSQ